MTPNTYTLAPPVEPWAWLPTEAECIAIDRCYAMAKQMGVLDRLRDLRALQQQLKEEPL